MIEWNVGKEALDEDISLLGETLKKIISENGTEVINDSNKIIDLLCSHSINNVLALQTALLFEASNVRNYLAQVSTGITLIDVNNMVTCAEKETGLTKIKIKNLLAAVLFGLSLPNSIASVPVVNEKGIEIEDTAILPVSEYSEKIINVKNAIVNKDVEKIVELAPQLELLVKAGIPDAFYLKGLCYLDGWAAEKNEKRGYQFIAVAAKGGHAEANAILGDYYFSSDHPNFTNAYQYYTMIGATAVSQDRQDHLKAILAEKTLNIQLMVINTIFLIMCFVFNNMLGSGAFSADLGKHWFWAVFSDILIAGTYEISIYQFVMQKFNSLKWSTLTMMLILFICAFFAL